MKKIARIAALVAACGSVGTFASIAAAADVNAAASGDWSAPATWTPNEPTAADNALINGGFNVGVTQAGEVANRVDLGTASGQTGTLTIASGNLNVGSATGVDPSVRLGTVLGGTGLLNMTGGTLNIAGAINGPLSNGDFQIGRDGAGTMTQSGGAVTVGDEIIVGTGNGAVGTLNMSGGTMTNGTLAGAGSGTGRSMILGFGLNSIGNATISGNAALTVRFDILMGLFDNGAGTLAIQDNAVVSTNFVFASRTAASTSSISQSGGTFTILGDAHFGETGTGSYSMSGGAMTAGLVFAGSNAGSNSTINQSAGSITLRAGAIIGANGTATYNHSAGTYAGNFLTISDAGTGTYNLSGAAVTNINGDINTAFFPAGTGTVNQTGGTLTAIRLVNGHDGVGVYNQSAGSLNLQGVFLGDFDTSSGTHRISGGTVNVAGNYSVGGALASNAPSDATRTGTQGQAVGAVGNFIVRGSAATITIGGDFLANPADNTRTDGADNAANLTFEILNASGTSLVNVGGEGDLDGAVVDLDLFSFTPSNGQVFNLISALGGFGATGTGTTQATGTGEGYSLLGEDTTNWTLRVVGGQTAGSEILQAVYQVPEPTSLAALGLTSVLLRRRRGAAR